MLFRNVFNEFDDLFPKIKVRETKSIPLPSELDKGISKDIEVLTGNLIRKINKKPEADTSELEQEIDQLVYELYGLSEEEIGIVQESVDGS